MVNVQTFNSYFNATEDGLFQGFLKESGFRFKHHTSEYANHYYVTKNGWKESFLGLFKKQYWVKIDVGCWTVCPIFVKHKYSEEIMPIAHKMFEIWPNFPESMKNRPQPEVLTV